MCGKYQGCGFAACHCGEVLGTTAAFADDGAEPAEVWKVVRFDEDYDLIEEAARAKRMPVAQFVAFAAAEYADMYLNAYEAAMRDVAEQIRAGRYE